MALHRVSVDGSGRYLQTEDGAAFFWLGDTAWELFHRLTLAETEHYFQVRASQGFNVIQAVVLAEIDGLHAPNANGHVPLLGDDPTRPNEFYFRHVDAVIQLAEKYGLYIALLPTWGDKVDGTRWGVGPCVFNTTNARVYGALLGKRYRSFTNIIWVLGGDRPATGFEDVWDAMAEGISEGVGYMPFFTYHPCGGFSSSAWVHSKPWLGMNMLQSGHGAVDAPNWEMISSDRRLEPAKPVIDAEPNYEHHPVDPYLREWKPEYGRFTEYDVRKQAYRSVLSGACGHTYGSHSVWQFYARNREPVTHASPPWDEAIYGPGACQMVNLRDMAVKFHFESWIPDQSILANQKEVAPCKDTESSRLSGDRACYAVAARDSGGAFELIYCPLADVEIELDLSSVRLPAKYSWFDPRTGQRHRIGVLTQTKAAVRTPLGGPDWVLVIESEKTG